LGDAIVSAMNTRSLKVSGATAGGGSSGHSARSVFEHVEVNLTAPNGGTVDPRAAAVKFARELERRGA
jgi:hypothetical protein